MKNPKHESYKDVMDWIGEDFDPVEFNIEDIVFDNPKDRLKDMLNFERYVEL